MMATNTLDYAHNPEELLNAWEAYVYHGVRPRNIRPDILQSWERCKELEVDPFSDQVATVLEKSVFRDIVKKKRNLIRIAKPYIALLNQYVKNSGFIIILSDENGTVLVLDGDKQQINYHKRINLMEGAVWTEEEVGTNAVGTSLFLQQPMQIVGEEHYCAIQHCITCSGAPIYSLNGKLEGVLNISGASKNVNIHTLGMVVASAMAIENQLKIEEAMDELSENNLMVNAAFESFSDGIITVDAEGMITHLNNYGAKLLGMDISEAMGKSIRKVLPTELDITKFLQKETNSLEIMWNLKNNNERVNISTNPMINNTNEYFGSVLVLKPKEKMDKLVNQITGAQAEFSFNSIIGNSKKIKKAKEIANVAAETNSTILLLGESGTGKELFAQAIHRASNRPGAFIAVNCSAIPRSLIESELFGYEAGTFTGASRHGRPGKFERAHHGTILLDEIGDMPLDLQAVLLRVLQERSIVRVGGYKPIPVDVRVVAATNANLIKKVEEGSFREDLYFRLNVISIQIPSLRERKDDIPKLVEFFLPQINQRLNRNIRKISPAAIRALQDYDWPGNVRELENMLERSIVVASKDLLDVDNLPSHITNKEASEEEMPNLSLAEIEKRAIRTTLEKVNSIAEASRILGISRSTLYRKMKDYGLEQFG